MSDQGNLHNNDPHQDQFIWLGVGVGGSCSQWMLCEGSSTFFFLLDEFLRERECGQERLKVVDDGWQD